MIDIPHAYIGTEARQILEERIAELEAEEPVHVFATKDKYKVIIRNKSGTDTNCGRYYGSVLIFPIPGNVQSIRYKDLCIASPGFSQDLRGLEERIGTINFWTLTGTTTYRFQLNGEPFVIYPFVSKDKEPNESCEGDRDLFNRIGNIFEKYNHFVWNTKHKPRCVKPFYDIERAVRRAIV